MRQYLFEPGRTRAAFEAIAVRFPIESDRVPRGLAALFQFLLQFDPAWLASGKGEFSVSECDLLCRFYHRTDDPAVLRAILLVLAARKDSRASQVARHLAFLDPPFQIFESLRQLWLPHRLGDPIDQRLPWFASFMLRPEGLPIAEHLWELAKRDAFSLRELSAGGDTPLLRTMTDRIVSTRDSLIADLPGEWLNARAAVYLDQGRDELLTAFVEVFPDSSWSPEFVSMLASVKGAPDPDFSPFYRRIAPGRLWRIRQKLFADILDDQILAPEKRQFWGKWLHHVRDLRRFDQGWRLTVGRTLVEETRSETRFYQLKRNKPFEVIPFDGLWMAKMSELLQALAK